MSMLLAALAGANMIYGLGMIDMGMTLDFSKLVIDNEIAKMVRRVMYGIPVNDNTVAVDLIRSVGAGNHFLEEDHTLENFRTNAIPTLFDRKAYHAWAKNGKKDIAEVAIAEARRIVETHKPPRLPKEVQDKLRSIVLGVADDAGIDVKTIKNYQA